MNTDLRTQFHNYMTLQRFSPHTKKNYTDAVKGLAKFYMQPPDKLTNEQVQEYFRYLIEDRKVSWGTCNNYFSGIASFYRNICKWDETYFQIPPRPRIQKLPVVYSEEEVKRLLDATDNLKHKVLLETAYSAGLRNGELIRLQPHHIESDPSRMLIRVEQGKGRKDRYTILSEKLLVDLRAYWKQYRPGKWVFPGQKPERHLTPAAVHDVFCLAKKKPA
jgi:integrase/recombinase XerD